jgi:dihydrofolate reductase
MTESRPRISLLAAVARNGVIGRGNQLPWHLPADLKRFKSLTLGHPVIMGRKTWDSIFTRLGKALPGRTSIVISHSALPGATAQGAIVAASLPEAVAAAGKVAAAPDWIFVIGGAQIYALALPVADRLDLTEIHADVEGDALFPPYNKGDFVQISREPGQSEAGIHYDFVVYDRLRPNDSSRLLT